MADQASEQANRAGMSPGRLVVLWTGFPAAFAAIASTLYLPLTLAAFGIIARGSVGEG